MAKKDAKQEEDSAKVVQQKYLELQICDQQLRQIQQQMQAVEQQVVEIEYVVQCLEEITKIEAGTEILVPMSSGIFIKASIADTKDALINVGGGTTVKKSIPEVRDMLRQQAKEMRRVQEELAGKMQELAQKAARIESDVRKLAGM